MYDIRKNNTKIIMPEVQKGIEDMCKRLWCDNFDDTDSSIEYYFNNRWKSSITILYNDKSMLHLNPYECMVNGIRTRLYYIVGVCTDIKYRKKGFMDACIRRAFDYMYKEREPFTYLMPASEEIYIPYGFTGIYPVKGWEGNALQLKEVCNYNQDIDIEAAGFKDYKILSYKEFLNDKEKQYMKQLLCEYANYRLSKDFTCYVIHDEDYFDELYKEVLACNGDIVTFWQETENKKEECIGYAVYLCEDKTEIAECILEPFARAYAADFFCSIFSMQADKADNKELILCETNYWGLLDDGSKKAGKNFLMARIIDIKAFVKNLCSDKRKEIFIELKDEFISGNNGRWHIIIDKSGGFIEKLEDDNMVHLIKQYTIDEFGKEYLNNYMYFLNEYV